MRKKKKRKKYRFLTLEVLNRQKEVKEAKVCCCVAERFEEEWRLFGSGIWCLRQGKLQSKEKRERGREMEAASGE